MSLKSANDLAREIDADDSAWANRAEFWRDYVPPRGKGRPKKFNYRQPLILCGHGARIRMDHNTLLVRNGFTHHPQKSDEIRFFPGDANLPDRIIILDATGSISFDALNWMSEQTIELVQLDWRGGAISVGGPAGYSANPKLVQAQRAAKAGTRGIKIARWLIAEKVEASILTLQNIIPKSEIRRAAINRLEIRISEIRNSRNSISMSRLLGIEGHCAATYFAQWQGLPIKWAGNKRKPIPVGWHEVSPRTMVWRKRARSARHPVNAMLNYGYGILANRVRSGVIAAGLDASIGFIHGNSQNHIPFVYDLMEPLRPLVDQIVLQFALAHEFTPGDFTISKWGGCRLNPQLASALVSEIALGDKPALAVAKFKAAIQC